jgi:hypothetical protein
MNVLVFLLLLVMLGEVIKDNSIISAKFVIIRIYRCLYNGFRGLISKASAGPPYVEPSYDCMQSLI